MNRTQLAFTIFAVVIALSMVAGTVALAVMQTTSNPSTSDEPELPSESSLEAEARRAAAENPDDPGALKNLANLLANLGKMDESISWYERALRQTPDDAALRLDFAQTLAQAGKPDDAELQFQKTIELDPQSPYAHYYLAELYRTWSPPRTDAAVAEYRRVIAVGPETFVADESAKQLAALGYATPAAAGTPATPVEEGQS